MNRILLGNRSSNNFGVVAATLQLGHSKSPYSTSVTRACSEPSRWSVGSGGTARLIGRDCALIDATPLPLSGKCLPDPASEHEKAIHAPCAGISIGRIF